MSTYPEIISQLQKKQYKPVYLLHGSEPFFIDKITDFIQKNVLTEAEKGFNQTVFYGRDADVGAIIETAKRYPMMAERQVVVIREAQDLKRIDELEDYMAKPVDSTILVLAFKYKKPDGRKKIFKNIKKTGIVFESKAIYENQMQKWVEEYVHQHKRNITPKATLLISEFIGPNLSLASNEIEKLFITVAEGELVEDHTVSEVIGINKDFNTFEFQKALGNRDVKKAMQIALYFANHQKEHPLTLTLTSLGRYYSNLILMYFNPKASKQDIARMIGVHPYFVDEFFTAKSNHSAAGAVKAIELIREYDLKSKGVNSAAVLPGELLKELVFKLLN
ncbi:MAG: DNA polymerase-3 subunit delta [Salibacteraceae bacterium]|jgi:DNA polymerase-3 subunit delta